jgi:hypothetical protein
LVGRPQFLQNTRYFRAACREIARSTDERTAIAAMLPPGVICGHTISVERRPSQRPTAAALVVVAVMNSFVFDWTLRQKAAAHVSLYILFELPCPRFTAQAEHFLAQSCLRLSCNHRGFAPLWHEQLGDSWRESSRASSWPVIAVEDIRWRLRAAMDAVIASTYGLDRITYGHILGSFSHKSYTRAPALCLAAFDDLAERGLEAFCRDHDPYFDIPLVAALAPPVVNLDAAPARQQSLRLARARS